jgi:hypothetical protein
MTETQPINAFSFNYLDNAGFIVSTFIQVLYNLTGKCIEIVN